MAASATMTVTAIAGSLLVILLASAASSAINLDASDAIWSYLADDSLSPEHLELLFRQGCGISLMQYLPGL